MRDAYQVQVGRRGAITFPKEFRDQNNIEEGDILNLMELSDDVFVISKNRFQVDEIANKLAREWQGSGETLDPCWTTCVECEPNMIPGSHRIFLDTNHIGKLGDMIQALRDEFTQP
ncbi:MAG: AbrB/MazE/SpoVT family DNA-binding domain-containing protein [Chloroflexota bacterium]